MHVCLILGDLIVESVYHMIVDRSV